MRLVFDNAEWSKTGDIDDNSQFWKPATLINAYLHNGDVLVDVVFQDGRRSQGHFYDGTKPLIKEIS